MRKLNLLPLLAMLFLVYAFSYTSSERMYNVNPSTSSFNFVGVTSTDMPVLAVSVTGGKFITNDDQILKGNFELNLQKISTLANAATAQADAMMTQLIKTDYLDVNNFPTATVDITKVESLGGAGRFQVTADVTMKGQTQTITFPANVRLAEQMMVILGDVEVNIEEWGSLQPQGINSFKLKFSVYANRAS